MSNGWCERDDHYLIPTIDANLHVSWMHEGAVKRFASPFICVYILSGREYSIWCLFLHWNIHHIHFRFITYVMCGASYDQKKNSIQIASTAEQNRTEEGWKGVKFKLTTRDSSHIRIKPRHVIKLPLSHWPLFCHSKEFHIQWMKIMCPNSFCRHAHRILLVTYLISMYCFGHLTGIQQNFPYELKTFFAPSKWKHKKKKINDRKKDSNGRLTLFSVEKKKMRRGKICFEWVSFENEHFSLAALASSNVARVFTIIILLICVSFGLNIFRWQ